ncbi:J domain-containing protein [Halosimplex halophilum]|uniref:J domain-containing protein n=1 Tax=Halosimplex halophilum TaxID=2559572 RepID=UPI00107F9B09|nr:DnaJ domain-containing protein [Halosimplex halophilum]
MTETFYDRLGVDEDATTEEIEDAYRAAIKRVHPDVSDEVDAGERTKRLNKAKRVLTDDEERARYDRLGHAAYTGEGTPDAGSTRTAAGDGDAGSDEASTAQSRPGGPDPGTEAGRSGDDGRRSGSDRASTGESTWRGSQQRGRRAGGGRSARGTDRRRRERARGRERGRGDGRATSADPSGGTTRSTTGSTGPSWQSSGRTAGRSAGASGDSPSAQRQAAAGASDGPNADWSWNSWDATGAWAVRNGPDKGRGLRLSRLFPVDQSVVLLVSTFVCYPFFVAATLYPAFPLVARVVVGVCTLLTVAYLLSIPEAAILVFGLWSVVVPILLLALPALSVFSLAGVIGLTATWVPLGMSVLTFTLVRS